MGTPHNYRYQLTVMFNGDKEWDDAHFTWHETIEDAERLIAKNSKRYSWKIVDTWVSPPSVEIRWARHRMPRLRDVLLAGDNYKHQPAK